MRVLVTGATGMVGSALCDALLDRGDEVVGTTRNVERARKSRPAVDWIEWDPASGPAPDDKLAGCDAVVNLAGEHLDQRWTDSAKERIRTSRIDGTRNLVEAIAAADPRPRVLVSASAVGYYGPRGDEEVDETTPPGDDFLARVCADWEAEALRAAEHGVRVVTPRSGVILSAEGGALKRMLTPFKLGVGGPVAGGDQYLPWIHLDDEVGMLLWMLDNGEIDGPVNAAAPEPPTNKEFSKALGRALRRPALAPVPGLALKVLYGEMSMVITTGQRAVPRRALTAGYTWRHPDLDEALRDAVA